MWVTSRSSWCKGGLEQMLLLAWNISSYPCSHFQLQGWQTFLCVLTAPCPPTWAIRLTAFLSCNLHWRCRSRLSSHAGIAWQYSSSCWRIWDLKRNYPSHPLYGHCSETFCIFIGGPGWVPVAYNCDLENVPFIGSSYFMSHLPVTAFWNVLPSEIPVPKFVSQVLFMGELKLRQFWCNFGKQGYVYMVDCI